VTVRNGPTNLRREERGRELPVARRELERHPCHPRGAERARARAHAERARGRGAEPRSRAAARGRGERGVGRAPLGVERGRGAGEARGGVLALLAERFDL